MSYGSKSHWSIKLHDFSECSFSWTTWRFGMIIIDNPRALELFPVVLEIEKETLLLVIVYHMPCPLGTATDEFILLINKLPTQDRISIVGDFNFDQMLPENVIRVDILIQNFNSKPVSTSTIFNSYTWRIIGSCIWYYKFQAVTSVPSPCSDHFVFGHYVYMELSFQQFSFQSSLHNLWILVLISCFLNLMKGLVKIFGRSSYQSKVIISFLLWNITTMKIKNNSFWKSWLQLRWLPLKYGELH